MNIEDFKTELNIGIQIIRLTIKYNLTPVEMFGNKSELEEFYEVI